MFDQRRAEEAVRELLLSLGQDVDCEGLKDTPKRVAEMLIEQCTEKDAELDRCFEEVKYDELIGVRNIPFVSVCQHHLVFYTGRAHVAYIPRKKLLGLSKLARLVYSCSVGFTVQEGVTRNIVDRLYNDIEPAGVMAVLEADHGCMSLRGARAIGSSTVTSAVRGIFRDVPAARQEFMALICKGNGK